MNHAATFTLRMNIYKSLTENGGLQNTTPNIKAKL